jgi:hypothetical protein
VNASLEAYWNKFCSKEEDTKGFLLKNHNVFMRVQENHLLSLSMLMNVDDDGNDDTTFVKLKKHLCS